MFQLGECDGLGPGQLGSCPQGYARTGLFIANLRARFSIGVCDLHARELGSVLMWEVEVAVVVVVGIRQKTLTNTCSWGRIHYTQADDTTTQPPRGSGGEMLLVVRCG